MSTVAELFDRLSGDSWRLKHLFSEDMLQANALLHNPAATEEDMAECLSLWSQQQQPCQFGKLAAKRRRMHFCFLTEEVVSEGTDDEIAKVIHAEKRLWKQRAAFDSQRAAHNFVLVVASPRVALAAPDKHLRAFSERLLELTGWGVTRRGVRRENQITSDYLYLRDPKDGAFYGFRFNIDFFACAGDGRWWRDHRFPGGIAFTANSTGHMMRFREWYEGKSQSETWALNQAMLTIRNAAPTRPTDTGDSTQDGRVTWLRSLEQNGKPLVENVGCPFASTPGPLEGKDWTRYEGLLHTDHAVRAELFNDREEAPTSSKPYLMDFTYLYDERQPDFAAFSRGLQFAETDIYAEIGRPEEWSHRNSFAPKVRSEEDAARVAHQLDTCRRWVSPVWHVADESQGST